MHTHTHTGTHTYIHTHAHTHTHARMHTHRTYKKKIGLEEKGFNNAHPAFNTDVFQKASRV